LQQGYAEGETKSSGAYGEFMSDPLNDPGDEHKTPGRSKFWNFDRILGLAALLLAVVTILYTSEVKAGLIRTFGGYWTYIIIGLSSCLLLTVLGLAFWRTRDLNKTKKELADEKSKVQDFENRLNVITTNLHQMMEGKDVAFAQDNEPEKLLSNFIPYKKDSIGRWDEVSEVRYGHLKYPPFVNYDEHNVPVGPGVQLLNDLLLHTPEKKIVSLDYEEKPRDWADILDGLREKKYNVIATPMFATFERSKKVRFSAPLFFSNVGLYVRKDFADAQEVWHGVTAENLRLEIRMRAPRLRFLTIKGEISEKLAHKYADKDVIEPIDDIAVPKIFQKIADTRDASYAIFAETFTSERDLSVKNNRVKNVLPWFQILYPVCFAVRIGDHQLANLLNIRLMELTQKTSMLDRFVNKLADDLSYKSQDEFEAKRKALQAEVAANFVTEWPVKASGK
jgi:Bacterial extracellular solute-binding proteins, family 3